MTGLEPAAPWSQTKCSTKLSHIPKKQTTLCNLFLKDRDNFKSLGQDLTAIGSKNSLIARLIYNSIMG